MRLEVYKDDDLVASFDYGGQPAYHGELGEQIKAVVERPHYSYNPWADRLARGPLDEGAEWWAAHIIGGLVGVEGVRVVGVGLPPLKRRAFWEARSTAAPC